MTDTYERCSCGDCPFGTPRDRAKCSKESLSGSGKMCVKDHKSDITVLDADVAFEMLDNPKAPNDKLIELLEGK